MADHGTIGPRNFEVGRKYEMVKLLKKVESRKEESKENLKEDRHRKEENKTNEMVAEYSEFCLLLTT